MKNKLYCARCRRKEVHKMSDTGAAICEHCGRWRTWPESKGKD